MLYVISHLQHIQDNKRPSQSPAPAPSTNYTSYVLECVYILDIMCVCACVYVWLCVLHVCVCAQQVQIQPIAVSSKLKFHSLHLMGLFAMIHVKRDLENEINDKDLRQKK